MIAKAPARDWYTNPDESLKPWIEALWAADGSPRRKGAKRKPGNLKPLIELLKSETKLPSEARGHIADLLERHTLKRHRGNAKLPSYRTSREVAKYERGKQSVAQSVADGMEREKAIELAASVNGIKNMEAFHNHLSGKNSGARVQLKGLKARNLRP